MEIKFSWAPENFSFSLMGLMKSAKCCLNSNRIHTKVEKVKESIGVMGRKSFASQLKKPQLKCLSPSKTNSIVSRWIWETKNKLWQSIILNLLAFSCWWPNWNTYTHSQPWKWFVICADKWGSGWVRMGVRIRGVRVAGGMGYIRECTHNPHSRSTHH